MKSVFHHLPQNGFYSVPDFKGDTVAFKKYLNENMSNIVFYRNRTDNADHHKSRIITLGDDSKQMKFIIDNLISIRG